MNLSEQIPPPAYFGSLTIENVKCFKGKHEIDLSDGNGKPAMWTVILGNNNTGKTTLLRSLADLEPTLNLNHKRYTPKIAHKAFPLFDYMLKCKWFLGSQVIDDDTWFIKCDGGIQSCNTVPYELFGSTVIYGYGTARKMGNTSLEDTENQDNTASLFDNYVTLDNAEEWLLQIDYASKNKIESAKFRLEKIKEVLINGILPDVKNFRCTSQELNNQIKNFVEVETDYGWVKLRELGYGYQVTLAWVVDLAKKLFERYPNSANPLHEPAIVLVDEIDLHLHPEWQRKIIQFLKTQFPKTQFIVTTHSPLIIQSMDDINLVLLEKEEDHVIIKQPDLKNYQGWTVEEILSDLMDLEGKTISNTYSDLIKTFNKAVAKDNYIEAKQAYDKLDSLLHPNNIHRDLLSLQLNSLSQEIA